MREVQLSDKGCYRIRGVGGEAKLHFKMAQDLHNGFMPDWSWDEDQNPQQIWGLLREHLVPKAELTTALREARVPSEQQSTRAEEEGQSHQGQEIAATCMPKRRRTHTPKDVEVPIRAEMKTSSAKPGRHEIATSGLGRADRW